MIGLAEIRLAEDFLYEGALEWNFKAVNTRNSWIFVKYVNLAVTWPNKLLSGEFRGKWSLCGRISRSWAIGPNNFLSGEIRVIRGKMHIIDFGYRQGILMVF